MWRQHRAEAMAPAKACRREEGRLAPFQMGIASLMVMVMLWL